MINPKGYYCDVVTKEERPILVMGDQEIREREQLQIANTASALRSRVMAELANNNGHGAGSY